MIGRGFGSVRWVAAVFALGAALPGCGEEEEPAQRAAAPKAVATGTDPVAAAKAVSPATSKGPRGAGADNAEAAESFAIDPEDVQTRKAPTPTAAKARAEAEEEFVSPGAPTDEQIARELQQMEAAVEQQSKVGGTKHGIKLERDGTATVADGVPAAVAAVVAGANAIAEYPYVYGGGHASFEDNAYDCSGSVSYALAAAGLLDRTMVSGEFAKTGAKGPGKWITIYANEGHMWMEVDGLRFDTSGRSGPLGTRWNAAPRSKEGFEVRHPPGL